MNAINFGCEAARFLRPRFVPSLRGCCRRLVLLLAVSALLGHAAAQTIILHEDFEPAFPSFNGWTVSDLNTNNGLYFWDDVNSGYGSVAAHGGNWKGYCASTNGTLNASAIYANNMQGVMTKSLNFAGQTGANLEFWYVLPSGDPGWDFLRVYIDVTNRIFNQSALRSEWTKVTLPLSNVVGGTHSLRFEFFTDFTVVGEGAYIDDIEVRGSTRPFVASQLAVSNVNYTGYVLDSDTFLGRSNIQARATFDVENFTGTNTTYTNVLSYRLINASNGVVHPIYGFGNANTNAGYVYTITNVVPMAAGTNFTVTNLAYLRPAARMNQFVDYFVECRMLTNGVLATTAVTPAQQFYHFTNTLGSDTAFNVLLNLTNAAWSQTYAVQTIPGQDAFQVDVDYEVRRWDDLGLGIAAANIPVVLNYTLRDTGGNLVSLTQNSQTFYEAVDSYGVFIFTFPKLNAFTRTLNVKPVGQIDSVTKQYYLTVTISHTNNPVSGQVITANTTTTTTNQLLHFNGNLNFGVVGTRMTGLIGTPPTNTPSGGTIPTTLSSVDGYVTLKTSHTYSGAGPIAANLRPNGDADVTGGFAILSAPSPDNDSVARVRFQRGTAFLTSAGGFAAIKLTLPAGLGYRTNDIASPLVFSMIQFGLTQLNAALAPGSDLTYAPGVALYVAEESKPAWIEVSQIVWRVGSGKFDLPTAGVGAIHVRNAEYSYLSAVSNLLVSPTTMGDKRSNDKYWNVVNGIGGLPTIDTDSGSNALLTTTFLFGSGGFRTHFPYNTALQWAGAGSMAVQNDLVTPGTTSTLNAPGTIRVTYTRDCSDCGGGGAGTTSPGMTSSNALLSFTRDGGIVAGGATLVPVTLEWGFINVLPDYAQRASNFVQAAFHMPGPFLRGDQNLLPDVLGPATILYTGYAVSNMNVIERPGSLKYKNGFADYAGMNFRAETDGAHRARSTIAGRPKIAWDLEGRSKYYVRHAGVTGIHEAVPGTFPSSLTLWGYAFTFNSYGLSYLDSQNKDSITDGTVTLPYPSNFQQDFDKMKFSCLGAPLNAEVPSNDPFKVMSYWAADFKTLAITFKTKNGCDPTEGYLVLGLQGHASHFEKPIYGCVGFFAGGDHIPKSFNLEGVDSRLKSPNVVKFDGPNGSTYAFTPVSDVYYNTWSNAPAGSPAGWISLYGKLDLPFFEDMQLHLQTSCRTNGVASSNSPIYLSGGWPRAGTSNPNHGWLDSSMRTPFQTNFFDWKNAGWPGGGGLTIDNYRDNDVEQYHPRAQRLWLGVVDFDYPMSWNSTLRSFKSWQERTNDLLILEVRHQVKYMDAKQAELDFGAQYDGLPSISIANIAFNAIDEATGVGSALVKAATQPIFDVLTSGLDEVNQLLDTQMNKLMDTVFDRTIDPIIDNWYGSLSNQWAAGWNSLPLAQKQQFIFSVQTNATNFFIGGVPGAAAQNLSRALRDVGSAVGEANNLIRQIEDYLRDATNAICSVVGTISMGTNGAALGSNVVGLIAKEAGERKVVPKLVQSLVGEIAPEFLNAVLGPTLDELTKEIEPTLTQITEALNQTKEAISQVEAQLHSAGAFTTEIDNTIRSFSSELTNVSIQVSLQLTQYFGGLNYSIDNPFQHLTATEVKQFVRQKIEDQFFATTAASQVQTILRQRLYDLDAAMREQIDTVFGQLNGMMRDLISQSLAELDNSINKALGDVSDVMGAGKINGHALIAGDSLKCLRIDAHFEWKAPDAMEFNAFLQIKELDSDGTPGCSSPSGSFTEVTLGASEIPFDWISPDLTASISVKFTFDGTVPFPVNFIGQLELNGDLSFEAFVLHDLAAAVAFGKYENYLSLKGGVRFNGYDFSGAIFFGRTCTLDPLLLIDPDVAGVLGNPPFTGAYVYAQGWLPISEIVLGIPASCLFQISAGIGAGAFFFVEGPTYGGKMFLGVSGDLLCIVSIQGDITMIGVKTGDDLRFKGKGHFEAEIGPCPFCISISKNVSISFINKSWKID